MPYFFTNVYVFFHIFAKYKPVNKTEFAHGH